MAQSLPAFSLIASLAARRRHVQQGPSLGTSGLLRAAGLAKLVTVTRHTLIRNRRLDTTIEHFEKQQNWIFLYYYYYHFLIIIIYYFYYWGDKPSIFSFGFDLF